MIPRDCFPTYSIAQIWVRRPVLGFDCFHQTLGAEKLPVVDVVVVGKKGVRVWVMEDVS